MANPLSITDFARMGGKARAEKLTKKERQDSARKAVLARWAKAGKKTKPRSRKSLAAQIKESIKSQKAPK